MAHLSIHTPSVTIHLGMPAKLRLIAVCQAADLSAAQLLRRAIRREEARLEKTSKKT